MWKFLIVKITIENVVNLLLQNFFFLDMQLHTVIILEACEDFKTTKLN